MDTVTIGQLTSIALATIGMLLEMVGIALLFLRDLSKTGSMTSSAQEPWFMLENDRYKEIVRLFDQADRADDKRSLDRDEYRYIVLSVRAMRKYLDEMSNDRIAEYTSVNWLGLKPGKRRLRYAFYCMLTGFFVLICSIWVPLFT